MEDWEVDVLEIFECEVTVRKWGPIGFATYRHPVGLSGRFLLLGPWILRIL